MCEYWINDSPSEGASSGGQDQTPPHIQLVQYLESQMIKWSVQSGDWGAVGVYEFTYVPCHLLPQYKMFTLWVAHSLAEM